MKILLFVTKIIPETGPTNFASWQTAGLGVCKDLNDAGVVALNTPQGNTGTNLCAPGSDDNVTFTEVLHFTFSSDVLINNFWFNKNHDGGIGSFVVAAGDVLDVYFVHVKTAAIAAVFLAVSRPGAAPTGKPYVCDCW